jgi:hypothetical protein
MDIEDFRQPQFARFPIYQLPIYQLLIYQFPIYQSTSLPTYRPFRALICSKASRAAFRTLLF